MSIASSQDKIGKLLCLCDWQLLAEEWYDTSARWKRKIFEEARSRLLLTFGRHDEQDKKEREKKKMPTGTLRKKFLYTFKVSYPDLALIPDPNR